MKYLLQRLLNTIPLLLITSALAFLLIRLAPGGPFDQERALNSPQAQKLLQQKYKLNQPIWKQYTHYLKNLLKGDLGPSLKHRSHTVNDILAQSLPITLTLGALAYTCTLCWGIPLGALAALAKHAPTRMLADTAALLGTTIPALILGPILIITLAIKIPLLPPALLTTPIHLILPVTTLGIYYAARIARLTQQAIQTTLKAPYILTAHAKGIPQKNILIHHILPTALLPTLSYSGPLLADLLTGSFIIETIFQIPGIGTYLIQSSLNRDYPMIMGLTLTYALILTLLNLTIDLTYRHLDPRIRNT